MSTLAGYNNNYPTPYGQGTFWVLTGLNFELNPKAGSFSMNMSLSGYPTADDANAGADPIGVYTFSLTMLQIVDIFSGAQSLVETAIQGSSSDWTNAVYVPPT